MRKSAKDRTVTLANSRSRLNFATTKKNTTKTHQILNGVVRAYNVPGTSSTFLKAQMLRFVRNGNIDCHRAHLLD